MQIETHRGPFGPLFASRRFIPAEYIHDIIINEALWRWNVRYYFAVMVKTPEQPYKLAVAFEVGPSLSQFPHILMKALDLSRTRFHIFRCF